MALEGKNTTTVRIFTTLFLLLVTLFIWPTSDADFFTRGARELLLTSLLAPLVLAYLIWRLNKGIAVFLVWIGLTTLLNILLGFLHIKIGYRNFAFIMSLAVIFYGVHKMNISTQFIIKSIAYVAILQALWGVFQRCSGIYFPFTYTLGYNTPVAGLDNASNFGAFLAISLPCCFYLHWIGGLFVLTAIVIANKFVSLAAGLAGLFFIYPSKKLLVILPILILAFFFAFKRQCLDWKSSSIMIRTKIWSESLKLAKYKPYIGFGSGNYKIVMPQYMQQKANQNKHIIVGETYDNPSNDYVLSIFQTGFISLAFILSIILITLKKYLYVLKTKELQTLFGSFVAVLLVSCGYSIFLNPTNAIWAVIIFGLLNFELRRISNEKVNNRNLRASLSW